MRRGRRCGPTPSNPNWRPAASAPSWRGATRRSTTARCGSSTPSPPASTSTTTSSPASPRSRRSRRDIASRSTTSASRCSITTGRQLRDNGLSGSAVVMLDGDCSFLELPAADPNLVGRLSGHAGRAAGVRHRRRSGRQDRRAARRGARPAWLDHGHLPAATRRLTVRRGKINGMGSFLLRAALTGVALWVVTLDRSRHQLRRRGHHAGRGSASSSSSR